jgi:hypothetical protein
MSETPFDQVITEHLTLSERNKRLERAMPLDRYREPHEDETADAPLSRQAQPSEAEPSAAKAELRTDPDSWWETKDGECPPPPLWEDDD